MSSDADLVTINPTKTWPISNANQHSLAGFTLYEGQSVTGGGELTMRRGHIPAENNTLINPNPGAQFLTTRTAHHYE